MSEEELKKKVKEWEDLYFTTAAKRNDAEALVKGLTKELGLLKGELEKEKMENKSVVHDQVQYWMDAYSGLHHRTRSEEEAYRYEIDGLKAKNQRLLERAEEAEKRVKSLEEQNRKLAPYGDAVSGKVHRELDKELREKIRHLEAQLNLAKEDENTLRANMGAVNLFLEQEKKVSAHRLTIIEQNNQRIQDLTEKCDNLHGRFVEANARAASLREHPVVAMDPTSKLPFASLLFDVAARNMASLAKLLEEIPPDVHRRFVAIEEGQRLWKSLSRSFNEQP